MHAWKSGCRVPGSVRQIWCSAGRQCSNNVYHVLAGHDLKLTDKVEVRSSGGKEAVGPRIIGLEVSAAHKTYTAAAHKFSHSFACML